jgi:ParB/RepB/Spo0J family partition protein
MGDGQLEEVSRPEATAGRAGRPRVIAPFVEPLTGLVEKIPLENIDLTDEMYRFRADLRLGHLVGSIREFGQQIPVLLRRVMNGQEPHYQIVSGFRRVTAIHEIGWDTVAGVVLTDTSDEEAFRISVLENVERKTYSDIDRALVIRGHEERGFGGVEVADIMGLSKRQKNNLKSLLELPADVQAAIADDDSYFAATHALLLKRLKGTDNRSGKYPELEYAPWIAAVNAEQLSIGQLTRRVNAEYKPEVAPRASSVLNPDGTDHEAGVYRFLPVRVELALLSEDERARLKAELEDLVGRL